MDDASTCISLLQHQVKSSESNSDSLLFPVMHQWTFQYFVISFREVLQLRQLPALTCLHAAFASCVTVVSMLGFILL